MDLTHYEAEASPKTAADTDAEWIVSPVPLGNAAPEISEGQLSVYRQFSPTRGRIWTQNENSDKISPALVPEDIPTRIVLQTQSAGKLVVADQYYPGWSAESGGKTLLVSESPSVFRTIQDVSSSQTITLRFAPTTFLLGLYLACAALLTCGTAIGYAMACNQQAIASTLKSVES